MTRSLLVALLLLPWLALGETISSSTCYVGNTTGCVNRSVSGYSSVAVVVSGAGWVGELVFEVAASSSGPFFRTRAYVPDGSGTYVTGATSEGAWSAMTAGFPYFRVRALSWTSGTATVTALANNGEMGVAVAAPDGGLPVTLGAQRVAVEATGLGGGPVNTTLAPETLTALGPQPYTLKPSDWVDVNSSSAMPVPPNLPDGGPGSMVGRSEIRIVNASSTAEVACDPPTADGGLPEWGVRGTPLFSNGGYGSWEVGDNVRVYCRARSGSGIPVAPLEKSQ